MVVALFARLNGSEAALAARVAAVEPGVGAAAWWNTPEGRVAAAVDEEVSTIRNVAQGQFDQTEGRDAFGAMPWIPPEMKSAVRVAFWLP